MSTITIKYCDKCKRRGDIVRTKLLPRLKKEFPHAEFQSGCVSFCGPGSQKPFVYVNDMLVYATNDDELIEQIHQTIAECE